MYCKKVLLSYKAPVSVVNAIENLGIEVVSSCEHKNISREISDHADMHIAKISDDLFVCAPEVYDYYKAYMGEKLICGNTYLGCNYPGDIAYNVARVGGFAFHNIKYTDPVVLKCFNDNGIKLISVNQGYTKCNMCIADTCVITSDDGIYKSCVEHGITALKISQGHIALDGYDYGFIGGASGQICSDTIFFAGDITCHPDFSLIDEFLSENGIKYISVSETPLVDIGSVIAF